MSHRRLLPASVSAVALAVVLAGCSGGGTSPSAEESEIPRLDATDAGTAGLPEIVWNLPYGEPTSIDPAFSSSESNSAVIANMCESLLLQNPDFTASPGLAEVTAVDDITYEVVIDERAAFWDGSPVTAEDVKFSIERTKNPDTGSTWAAVLANVSGVEVTGDRTATIRLSVPDALFAAHLATPAAAVVQRAFVESTPGHGTADGGLMCSGPFELGEWALGEDITLTKSDDYWNPERAALSDSLRFTFNTDAASATTAMQRGEITGSYNFAVSGLDTLADSDGSVTFGTSLGLYGLMTVNVDNGPLADIRVREALQLAIDYAGIRDGVFQDAAEINKTFTPRAAWGYSEPIFESAWDAIAAGTTDLDAARDLLAEAPAQERPVVLSYYADLPEDAQVASSVQAAAAEIGLEVELNPQTASENIAMYFDAAAREGTDLMVWAGYLDVPEPAAYYQYYTSDGVFNVAGFSDAEFDSVVSESRTTLDDDARAELITTAQAIYADNRINFPIVSQNTRTFLAEGVTGAVTSQAFLYSPWAVNIGTAE
ncbi:ABC transporter substrate-binding protein [Microbacterium sp. CCNWLW134]|uniref:ABC transporter substrate-binding protein n=1 Tax=Microbacterium sp. CCNWLW134 TaxID=3122064 RepID=UPI00300F7FC7